MTPFKPAILALAVTTLLSVSAALAQPAHPQGVKTGSAVGIIRAVDLRAGMVTIQHEPIPAIG